MQEAVEAVQQAVLHITTLLVLEEIHRLHLKKVVVGTVRLRHLVLLLVGMEPLTQVVVVVGKEIWLPRLRRLLPAVQAALAS
jgi:hypothetical protein